MTQVVLRWKNSFVILLPVLLQNCSLKLVPFPQEGAHANLIHSHAATHDLVALASCNRYSQPIYQTWLKNISRSVTMWTLPNPDFLSFLRNNTKKSMKTDILLSKIGPDAIRCLCPFLRPQSFYIWANWMILDTTTRGDSLDTFGKQTTVMYIRCDTDQGYQRKTFRLPIVYMNQYLYRSESLHHRNEPTPLKNTDIRVACVGHTALNRNALPDCHSWQADIIFEAVAMRNVTVQKTFYSNRTDLLQQTFEGNIDMLGSITAINSESYTNFSIPPVIAFWYESFWTKRISHSPLSFYAILDDSKVALLLVAAAMSLVVFALVSADMGRIRDWSFDFVAVSFTFLLASFYGTSSAVPRARRFATVSGFICGLWLVGILPFSNYFRGELTSRVTLRTRPEQLDNIEKLERALDEGTVLPCVVVHTYLHDRLLGTLAMDSIHRKLHEAFVRNSQRTVLKVRGFPDCLQCGNHTDRICFIYSTPRWYLLSFKRGLVESAEPLGLISLSVPVRKNYPRKTGLHKLIRRILETALLRQPEDFAKLEHLRNYDDQNVIEPRPLELSEFASFFLVFIAILCVSVIVLAFELLLKPKQEQ